MTKTLDTLVEDIYGLFDKGHASAPDNLSNLGKDIAQAVNRSLRSADPSMLKTGGDFAPKRLRMSNLGKKDRQIWYDLNNEDRQKLRPNERIKFLFGDILEAVLIFLAKEAGHEVSSEQDEVQIEGVLGHLDCEIDGTVVDCKSASPYSFKKFKDGTLANDDPFGYIQQVSAYAEAKGKEDAAFLAIDKQNGNICVMKTLKMEGTQDRIKYLKDMVSAKEPPAKCYEDIPDGKSGNMKLPIGCSYCQFKRSCWADANGGKGLRTFLYSTGPRYLTNVSKEPDVMEVKGVILEDEE